MDRVGNKISAYVTQAQPQDTIQTSASDILSRVRGVKSFLSGIDGRLGVVVSRAYGSASDDTNGLRPCGSGVIGELNEELTEINDLITGIMSRVSTIEGII